MKAWKRILIKVIVLLLVIGAAGGGAAAWHAYRQSTPEYAMDKYLSLLIDNDSAKAYALLDQSEDGEMTTGEYEEALTAKKYSLYASYKISEVEKRRDNEGNEYIDYKAEFMNAADEVQLEEAFTVKKQSELALGIFEMWKVMSGHCMVKDFRLTVPTGSEVYLDNQLADTSWIVRDGVQPSYDCYQIPNLIPGKISLVVRHPALQSVNTTLDALSGEADFTGKMALKKNAQDECLEIGVNVLKKLYSQAAMDKTDDLEELFGDCQDTAKTVAEDQAKEFNKEDAVFKSAAISAFAAKFGDLVFTEEENGAITTEMTFSYHYVVKEDVTADTEEVDEEGNPIQQTQTSSLTGDNTIKLNMAFYNGAWHVASMDMPIIPK